MAQVAPSSSGAVLITGASRGIGRALAEEFAAQGHDLVLTARNRQELDELAQSLRARGRQAWVMPADLTRPQAPRQLYDQVAAAGIVVEVLVNNAGFGNYGRFDQIDWPREAELLQVNITALTELTKLYARDMVARRRGRIMNVASTGAFQPGPLLTTYYASKAYVLSFSEALACELRGTGVTVTCLCPGATRTHFMQQAGMDNLRLFRLGLMDARDVARCGYRGTLAGRTVVVPGLMNKLGVFAVRFTPRNVVTRIVYWLMSRA
ncbi:MAG: SDR family oxidoreductase [Pirellulales bacterium]|nr:SDR family oxidoreductase [Pirellulales bacterium]